MLYREPSLLFKGPKQLLFGPANCRLGAQRKVSGSCRSELAAVTGCGLLSLGPKQKGKRQTVSLQNYHSVESPFTQNRLFAAGPTWWPRYGRGPLLYLRTKEGNESSMRFRSTILTFSAWMRDLGTLSCDFLPWGKVVALQWALRRRLL